jgi:hypothetical protein
MERKNQGNARTCESYCKLQVTQSNTQDCRFCDNTGLWAYELVNFHKEIADPVQSANLKDGSPST